tara:strand:- start:390 stop:1163 length:774 start_codon:yes stop_codon:yes gene_type:complete
MNVKEKYTIREIDQKEAMDIILEKHYLHRARPSSYSFGLFEGEELIGVILYSVPASPSLCMGICGKEERNNVMELARLWIKDDSLPNAESFLIANTMKKVKEDIIVSYSEPQHKHRGVVYQATNFIYCGLSAKRTDPKIKGMENKHPRGFEKNTKALKEEFGDENVKTVRRSRKHRYVYFNCSKGKRKYLIGKLKYKVFPYPKTNYIPTYNQKTPGQAEKPKVFNPLQCDVCKFISKDKEQFEWHLNRRYHLEQVDR